MNVGGGGREAPLRFLLLRNLDHLLGGLHVARLCLPKACSVLAALLEVAQFAVVDWIVLFNYVGDVSCDDVTCRYAGPPTEHVDDFECSRHIPVGPSNLVDVLVPVAGGPESQVALGENGFLQEMERSTCMHSMFPGSPLERIGRGKEWLLRTRYVVSHAWIQVGHPDPERVQLKGLVRELTLRAGLTGSGVGASPNWPSAVPRTRSSVSPRLTLGSRRKVINVD